MPVNIPSPDKPCATRCDEDADEREFEAFARAQNPLDLEAAHWVVRQRAGLDAAGNETLQAWLQADPQHGMAFEDMAGVFDELRRSPRRPAAYCPPTLSKALRAHRPAEGPARWPWRAQPFLARAAIVALVFFIGVGGLAWEQSRSLATFEQAYATERGQQLTLHLPDHETQQAHGSLLQLDTLSQADVRLYRDRREVRLKEGQAMFTVHSDAQRPFHVWVGPLQVTVVGTRFSVRHTASGLNAGRSVIVVEEGRVSVAQGNRRIELGAGQMVVTDDQGQLSPVTAASPDAIAPWRKGRVSFDQTPLVEALAEFERYGHVGFVVRDPTVAKLPVGGSYKVQQFERFVKTLPQVLPVSVVPRDGVMEIVAR